MLPVVIVPLVFTLVTDEFPSCTVLLASTIAPLPIAVALVRFPERTSALLPMAVFLDPYSLFSSAFLPMAVLLLPVVLA